MKKLFLLGIFLPCCLVGCASWSKFVEYSNNRPFSWSGRDFERYVQEHGAPVSSYKLKDDNLNGDRTIYTFVEPCPSSASMQKTDVFVKENGKIYGDPRITNPCPQN